LGSLGVVVEGKTLDAREEAARKDAYKAMFLAIVMHERSMGMSVDVVERQFGIKNFEGVEEKWRDELLWLLGSSSTQGATQFTKDVYKQCGMEMSQLQESFWRQKEK
jgi:hypothetical protein